MALVKYFPHALAYIFYDRIYVLSSIEIEPRGSKRNNKMKLLFYRNYCCDEISKKKLTKIEVKILNFCQCTKSEWVNEYYKMKNETNQKTTFSINDLMC